MRRIALVVPALALILASSVSKAQDSVNPGADYCEEITENSSELIGCLKLLMEELVRDVRTLSSLVDETDLLAREANQLIDWCQQHFPPPESYAIGQVRANSTSACVKTLLILLENDSTLNLE